MFNCTKFLKDYNIQTSTKGKNTAPGWIQIKCPMCRDDSNHGGFNIKSGMYNCWQCGTHQVTAIIRNLLNISNKEAFSIWRQYQTNFTYQSKEEIKHAEKVIFPIGTGPLLKMHKDYLHKRKYEADKLEKEYSLKGTNHIGEDKFRIICPIYLNYQLISYIGRDITNKSDMRYKACSKENEVIHYKHTLYNIDQANKDSVIIVEGVTDVWRLGNNSIATFGIKYTIEQLYMIAEKYNRVFVLFDPGAEEQANDLALALSSLNIEAQIIFINKDDPGDMTDEEAQYLNKQLIGE